MPNTMKCASNSASMTRYRPAVVAAAGRLPIPPMPKGVAVSGSRDHDHRIVGDDPLGQEPTPPPPVVIVVVDLDDGPHAAT
jgi:hypothetical protein